MDIEDYESLPETSGVVVHMSAGAAAGIMEHCVMYPLDSVKTRMQSIQPAANARYKTIREAFHKMIRHEGILRPVRGMSAVVVGAGPAHALYFSCYEKLKSSLSNSFLGNNNPVVYAAAGGVATLLHDGIMNPAEVIKQRMQVYNSPYKGCVDCVKSIYKTEGLKAFYRSYTTQLTMNIPFQCFHFMTYEFMQQLTNPERAYSPIAHMFSGAAAGGFSAALTTPLDVCKTLLNTQEKISLNEAKSTYIKGLVHAVKTVYHCCGVTGYFRGMKARVISQTPATAISWSVYEFFKYFLAKRDTSVYPTTSAIGDGSQPIKHFTAQSTSMPVTASTST